jgi:hypothetical protein
VFLLACSYMFVLACSYAVDAHSRYLPRGLIGTAGPESMHLTLERKYGIINTVQVADWSNRAPAVVVYLPIGKWPEWEVHNVYSDVYSVSVKPCAKNPNFFWPVSFKSEEALRVNQESTFV